MDTTILDMMSKPELINLIVFLLKNKIVQPNFQQQMVAHPQEMQLAQPTFHNIQQQMHIAPQPILHNEQSTMVAQPTLHPQSTLHNIQSQMVAQPREMQLAQPTFHNIQQQMHIAAQPILHNEQLHNVQSTMVAQPTFHNIQSHSILHNIQLKEEPQDIALRQLFVRDIAFTTTNEMLANAYSKYGNVESARIQFERTHNSNYMRSRGFGFVTFERAEDANKATSDKNLMIDGRLAECHLAVNGKYTRPINKHYRS